MYCNYFVKIKSVSPDINDADRANKALGLPSYTITAEIPYGKKDEKDLYENATINLLGNPPELNFLKSHPELDCSLKLRKENANKYLYHSANWYFKDKKFYSFENHQEITKEVAVKLAENQIPIAYPR